MKNIIVAATLASTFIFAGAANATTATINFTGTLSNVTCTATPGAGSGTGSDFNIDFGTVAFADLSDVNGTSHGGAKYINVNVNCPNATGLTTVKAAFDPAGGSGMDLRDRRLLRLATGSIGSGVGIALLNDDNTLMNLSGNDMIEAPLVPTAGAPGEATASMVTRAAYVLNGDPMVPGPNTAQLPFTLTFE